MAETIHTVVFKAAEGGGNPCPVTLDADSLTAEQMKKLSAQFGQESAFVCSPTRSDCDVKVRYFVPNGELEMCMHATIGTATVLVEKDVVSKSPIVFESAFGPMNVFWEKKNGKIDVGVDQFLPQYPDSNPTAQEVCKALGIKPEQLGDAPIMSAATSRFKLMILLKSREVLDGLNPDYEYLWSVCDKYNTTGFYPFVVEDNGGETVYFARQFPKRSGYNEDPATGVAASALGAYLVDNGIAKSNEGWNSFTVMQGFAMGRPSMIYSDILVENGKIVKTRVKGNAEITEDHGGAL